MPLVRTNGGSLSAGFLEIRSVGCLERMACFNWLSDLAGIHVAKVKLSAKNLKGLQTDVEWLTR